MELNLSPEQADIRDSVATFLSREVPFEAVRRMSNGTGIDDRTWSRCVELGWIALGVNEDAGGVGFGVAEEVVLAREIGRHLTPGPFVSTMVAAHLAELANAAELLATLLGGEQQVGLVIGEFVVDAVPGGLAVRLDDDVAAIVRVVGLEPSECVDPTVRLGRAQLGGVVATAPSATIAPLASLLYGAAALGVAEFAMRQSVEYAKDRKQFGRPIGSFQAIKHLCADMAIRAYSAYAQLAAATISLEAGSQDASLLVDSAVLLCLEAARDNTAVNIQIHGGIGFTDEHSAGWYLKRAHVLDQMAGAHGARTARLVGAPRMEFS
jgi:alkylation response protein AidB-like acyl-CoA dehydrogenase